MKLLFTGDTMFDRRLKKQLLLGQNPLIHVSPILKSFDYVVSNLETVISDENQGIPLANKTFRLRSPVECLDLLKSANITILNLANNHTMDFEKTCLLEMLRLFEKKGLKYFGAGENINDAFAPLILDTNDGRIAFLGFNRVETHRTKAGDNTAGQAFFKTPDRMKQAIHQTRKTADLVFVLPHWGVQYTSKPHEKQIYFGQKFIDWGADLVVGNHPHVFQGSTKYKGKHIYYSLGNFCFSSGNPRPEILKAKALEVVISNKAITGIQTYDVELEPNGIPHFV